MLTSRKDSVREINILHTDHGLQNAHIIFLKTSLQEEEAFFIKVLQLPESLTDLPCALYGPVEGDLPIGEDRVRYEARNGRPCASRLLEGAITRNGRFLVAIGTGEEEQLLVFTAYGSLNGCAPPREPGDPDLKTSEEKKESADFWSKHALAEHA